MKKQSTIRYKKRGKVMIAKVATVESANGYKWTEASFFNLSLDLLCIADFDGYFKHLNPTWEKTLGFTKAELLVKPFIEFIHPEDRAKTLAEIEKLKAGIETTYFENRYLCKDGSYKWLLWNAMPFPQKELLYAAAHDITDRKQTEVALQESKQESNRQILNILESIADAFFTLDRQWKFTYLNPKAEELLHRRRSELLGQNVWNEFPEAIGSAFYQQYHKAVEEQISVTFEEYYPPLDGWFEVRAYPSTDGLSVYFRNITRRKQSEAAIRESEERWQLALRGSNDGIWDWNLKTNEVFFSTRWKEMLGYEDREVENHVNGWAKLVHPEDMDWVVRRLQDHLAKKTPFYIAEHRLLCKDGTYKWILARAQALWDETGAVRVVGSHTDMTSRRQMEEALRQANEALEMRVEQRTAQLSRTLKQLKKEIAERQEAETAWHESESRLNGILNSLKDVVWSISTTSFNLLFINPAAEKIYGRKPQAFFDNPKLWLEVIHPEDRTRVEQANSELCREGHLEIEYRIVHEDGEVRWVQNRAWLVYDETGKAIRKDGIVTDITDRKLSEQAQTRLIAILEATTDFVGTADVTGNVLYLNRAARQMCGIGENEDISTRHISDFCAPSAAEKILEQGLPAAIQNSTWSGETIFQYCDSREIPVSQLIMAHKGEDGEVKFISTIARDISERKQVEERLTKQELTLRTILDRTPIWMWMTDTKGRMQFVNKTFCEDVGIPEPQFLEVEHYSEVLGLEASANCMASDVACWSKDTPHHSEEILPFVDGKLHDLEIIKAQIKDESGTAIGLIGLAVDVTERRQQARELQQSEARYKKLAQQEKLINRLASDIRNSLDANAILETTLDEICNLLQIDRCLFMRYNTHIEPSNWEVVREAKVADLPSLLGSYRTKAVAPLVRKIFNLEIVRVDDVASLNESVLRQFFLSVGFTSMLALPIQTPSGAMGIIICAHCSGVRRWSEEEVELLQAVSHQLAIALFQAELYTQSQEAASQARERALELEQTLHQLQQTQAQLIQTEKMSSLGQLVAGVAHEINNPVNFIYGNIMHAENYIQDLLNLLHLYQKHYPNPSAAIQEEAEAIEVDFVVDDLPKLLASMKMGADRIRQIVLSLRNFSRLDEAEMKAVDIHEGIDSTLLILHNRLKSKPEHPPIEIVKEYGNLPKVECYPGQLNQVFMNLINNAIDALESSRGTGNKGDSESFSSSAARISICTEVVNQNSVAIRIRDNGMGMTETVKARLFDPFFTTKPVGKGTGLGLSIAYQIVVEKHGGILACESKPGQGAEFRVEIPIHQNYPSITSIARD